MSVEWSANSTTTVSPSITSTTRATGWAARARPPSHHPSTDAPSTEAAATVATTTARVRAIAAGYRDLPAPAPATTLPVTGSGVWTMSGVSATSTAMALTAALRAREISSRELLELYLERIDRLDRADRRRERGRHARRRACREVAAAAADDALARGDDVGPLHGLPMTIKDAIETEGIRSTGGAVELADHVPTADAPAVARLKTAGAIVFGKTNLPALLRRQPGVQRAVRHHEQPVVVRARPRWVVGRLGGRARGRLHRRASSAPTSGARCAARRTAAGCTR